MHSQQADSSSIKTLKQVQLSGYMEFYAAYDDDDNNKHQRPGFLYHNTRTGELALNIGFLKASWDNGSLRGNMALMTGTYAERNLATESEMFQHVYEANIGIKISKKKNWWLDIGILNSHIGLETAIGKDNPTLTRSLIAENSPYYETGARASYTSTDKKFYFAVLVLNGWQRIYKLDGDYLPALGIQVTWKPSDKLTLNYSNYLGDESNEEDFGPRFFNDFYFIYSPSKKFSLQGAFDFGMQPDFNDEDWPIRYWNGWFAIAKFSFNKKLSIAARAEYYGDPDEVIVVNVHDEGFVSWGYSLNLDYQFHPHALFRLEGRSFDAEHNTFENRDGELKSAYNGVTICLAVSL